MRNPEKRRDLRGRIVQSALRHGSGAKHGPVTEAARIEHCSETAHYPRLATPTNEVDEIGLRAVLFTGKRLKRTGAKRDAPLKFGEPAPFRRTQRHFFSGFSVPS